MTAKAGAFRPYECRDLRSYKSYKVEIKHTDSRDSLRPVF